MADNSFDPREEMYRRMEEEIKADLASTLPLTQPVTHKCPLSSIERCLFSSTYPVADCNYCPTLNDFLRHIVIEEITVIKDNNRELTIEEVASHIRDVTKAVLEVRRKLLFESKPPAEMSDDEVELLAGLDSVLSSLTEDIEEEIECASKVITAIFKKDK